MTKHKLQGAFNYNNPRTVRKVLDRFYREVLAWVLNPERNPYGFEADYGLCDNVYQFACSFKDKYTHEQRWYRAEVTLYYALRSDLIEETGTVCTPFNSTLSTYVEEGDKRWQNKDRLAFLVNKVVSKKLQSLLKSADMFSSEEEKHDVMASGLCPQIGFNSDCETEFKLWLHRAYGTASTPFNEDMSDFHKEQSNYRLFQNPKRRHFIEVMTAAVREA